MNLSRCEIIATNLSGFPQLVLMDYMKFKKSQYCDRRNTNIEDNYESLAFVHIYTYF